MTKIKTLLIDDEPISIRHLKSILIKNCPEIEVIATSSHIEDALEKVLTTKPDLVFLDIELGGENGFDLLKNYGAKKFEIIFVTAHNQFGIEAVKAHALDYILKPINKTELLIAVANAVDIIQAKKNTTLPVSSRTASRLPLPTMEGIIFVEMNEIIFIESEGRYSRFYLNNNTRLLVSKNLGEFEEELEKKGFARIHHSYIVNLSFVEKYIRGRGGYVVLKNGKSLEVSSRKKDDFFGKLD